MKKPSHVWIPAAAIAAVGVIIGAYFLGRSSSGGVSSELITELETLRGGQSEAAIVKRVSQQMENIAYQQKAVSDQERDRAEQQSILALKMRDRAEQESHMARSAEKKANDAAKEAERQREKAMNHQKEAELQRDEATHAKRVADTLTFRTLGRTLGSASLAQYESGNDSLASALAYGSWYFLKHYKGDTYQPECFASLKQCSKTTAVLSTRKGGAITALYPLIGIGCVAATDYGEIEIGRKNNAKTTVLISDPKYNFVSIWADNSTVYALSLHGPLLKIKTGKKNVEFPLPDDRYFRILQVDTNDFVIASKRHIVIFNKDKDQIFKVLAFEKNISEITGGDGQIAVFYEDGSAELCGPDLKFKAFAEPAPDYVTAVYYEEKTGAFFFGYNTGRIRLFSASGEEISILGHSAKVTQIMGVGNILVSTSYDKNLYLWDIEKGNWMSPASVKFNGWPLSVCQFTDTEIGVGVSNGMLHRMNVSTDSMAESLKESGKVFIDRETWRTQIGASVPYINFLQ